MERGSYTAGPAVADARRAVLEQIEWYSEPGPRLVCRVNELPGAASDLHAALGADGVVLIDLDRGIEADELYSLATSFGIPQAETDAAVQQFVTNQAVLDLPTAYRRPVTMEFEPFSQSALRFHTEASVHPPEIQPRVILLACLSGETPDQGLQTVLVPTEAVVGDLPKATCRALSHIHVDTEGAPPLLRREDGRTVLATRDFSEPMPWICRSAANLTNSSVTEHLDILWKTIYNKEHVRGVGWGGPCLLLLDNTRFLHGRTMAGPNATGARRLRRVRVQGWPGSEGGSEGEETR